jgi:hypothetical protein
LYLYGHKKQLKLFRKLTGAVRCGFIYYIVINWFGFMVFNATFNNISVIAWQSVLLVEEMGGLRENHQPATCH